MSPPPPLEGSVDRGGARILTIFILAFAIRAGFASWFPTIHGGDAAGRLAHADSVQLGYQLPLPQLLVVAGKAAHDDPLFVRLLFSACGAVLAAGGAALLALVAGPSSAWLGGLLLAFDPLLIHYSIVPYQEPLAYGLTLWAFALASARPATAAFLMALACLSRFEAWIFLPAFLVVSASRRWAILAAVPILGWIAWWRGLAPPGLYVLDLDPGADRWPRLVFLAGKLLEYEGGPILLLALASLAAAIRRADTPVLRVSGVLTGVIVISVGLGHEYPVGSGLMSERLIHLPVLLCLLLAATGLGSIASRSRPGLLVCLILVLGLGARNLRFESRLLQAAAIEPDLALARDLARAIERARADGECVTVRSAPVSPGLLEAYVGKVGAAGGDVSRARERAALLAASSPDLDRIAAHLRAPPRTARRDEGCPLLAVVDNFGSKEPNPGPTPLALIRSGAREASLHRIHR